jgi:hypothetical protein
MFTSYNYNESKCVDDLVMSSFKAPKVGPGIFRR